MNLFEHQISTKGAQQMTKVTNIVREDIAKSGVKDGIIFSSYDCRFYH